MFMRYRGGGIGHKHMREVEEKYENMSRERLHGKQPRPKPHQTNNANTENTSDSNNEPEDPEQPGMSQGGRAAKPVSGNPDDDGNESDWEESDDGDDTPLETHSDSGDEGDVIDSDEITSDCNYDSYGLADL